MRGEGVTGMRAGILIALSVISAAAGYALVLASITGGFHVAVLAAGAGLLAASVASGLAAVRKIQRLVKEHIEEDEKAYRSVVDTLAGLRL